MKKTNCVLSITATFLPYFDLLPVVIELYSLTSSSKVRLESPKIGQKIQSCTLKHDYYLLTFYAPFFRPVKLFLPLFDDTLELEINPVPFKYLPLVESVRIGWIDNGIVFYDWMTQADNKSFYFNVPKHIENSEVAYFIAGIDLDWQPCTSGTQFDKIIFDTTNHCFLNILDVSKTRNTIRFDPQQLVKRDIKNPQATVRILNASNISIEDYLELFELQWEFRENYVLQQYYQSKGEDDIIDKETGTKLLTNLVELIKSPEQILLTSCAASIFFENLQLIGNQVDTILVEEVFKHFPLDSIFWNMPTYFLSETLKQLKANQRKKMLYQLYDKNPYLPVKANALVVLLQYYIESSTQEYKNVYNALNLLINNNQDYSNSLIELNPDSRIQSEKILPDFSFSMIKGNAIVTKESIMNHIVLLHFWDTSVCGRAQLMSLRKIYNKINSPDFLIIHVVLEDRISSIKQYLNREELDFGYHTYESSSNLEYIKTCFEITKTPKLILVDASGTIVGVDDDLFQKQLSTWINELLSIKS